MRKGEQETIIRWDQEKRTADLWTAYESDACRWQKAGYRVRVYASDRHGNPMSWSAEVPCEAIRYRRVQDGEVLKRRGHRKGRLLGVEADEMVGADG